MDVVPSAHLVGAISIHLELMMDSIQNKQSSDHDCIWIRSCDCGHKCAGHKLLVDANSATLVFVPALTLTPTPTPTHLASLRLWGKACERLLYPCPRQKQLTQNPHCWQ